jgi:hypothetical protein
MIATVLFVPAFASIFLFLALYGLATLLGIVSGVNGSVLVHTHTLKILETEKMESINQQIERELAAERAMIRQQEEVRTSRIKAAGALKLKAAKEEFELRLYDEFSPKMLEELNLKVLCSCEFDCEPNCRATIAFDGVKLIIKLIIDKHLGSNWYINENYPVEYCPKSVALYSSTTSQWKRLGNHPMASSSAVSGNLQRATLALIGKHLEHFEKYPEAKEKPKKPKIPANPAEIRQIVKAFLIASLVCVPLFAALANWHVVSLFVAAAFILSVLLSSKP